MSNQCCCTKNIGLWNIKDNKITGVTNADELFALYLVIKI